jgi:hypothetical protein
MDWEWTTPRLQALRDYIASVPALAAQPMNPDGASAIADALNADASPTFTVYRTTVETAEVGIAVSYVAVEAMTDANRTRVTTFYAMNPQSFDPSRQDIRTFWANTFSGTLGGAGASTRAALEALWRRKATALEKLFATGAGTDASPGLLTFEGSVSYYVVEQARAS